jgi:hypothetical protein
MKRLTMVLLLLVCMTSFLHAESVPVLLKESDSLPYVLRGAWVSAETVTFDAFMFLATEKTIASPNTALTISSVKLYETDTLRYYEIAVNESETIFFLFFDKTSMQNVLLYICEDKEILLKEFILIKH